MSFFLTKKSKHAMKERRKKKLLAEKGLLPPPSSTTSTVAVNMTNGDTVRNNKRSLSEMTMEENDGAPVVVAATEASQPQISSIASTLAIQNHQTMKKNQKTTIIIPSNLTPKEIKKFRKDKRRQLRSDGMIRSDDDVRFVVEGGGGDGSTTNDGKNSNNTSTEPTKKKTKRIYPCINDLVRLQQQQQQEEEDKAKPSATILSTNQTGEVVGQAEENLDETYTSQYVALDCEMVGIGNQGRQSALARVSIVDWYHNVLLDTYVQVPMKVTDYRTAVSGIKPKHIQRHNNAMDVNVCRTTVANILQNKILVGHALKNDLDALMLTHPHTHIRDTAKYRPFQRLSTHNQTQKWRPRKLRDLVHEHCQQLQIQQAGQSHNSIEDAIATMKLFQTVHQQWEYDIVQSSSSSKKKK